MNLPSRTTPRSFSLLLASSLSFVAVVAACSGSNSGAPGGPDGGTSQQCTTFETCPSYACRCNGAIVNSARCVDNYCLDEAHTCATTCGTEIPNTGGDSGVDATKKDGSSPPPAGAGDPCVPVSVSAITPRVGAISAIAAAHMITPPTPANGSVDVTKTSSGKPSRITYDAAGSADDYTDDFSYTSDGLLSRFTHDAAGSTNDYTEDYSYTSSGRISRFTYDASGSTADYTDDFSYTSAGLLSRFTHDASGSLDDVTDDFSYTSAGLVSRFTRDASGSLDDLTEDFSYTSAGLCSRWTYDASGSANDSSIDVSYDSSGAQTNLTSNGPRATGAVVKACK
jgi:hypothetical protein